MSEHDRLSELGKELPWDRPDAARRDAVRSSLLVAATERDARPSMRWYVIGGAFAAGAVAAAVALMMFVRDDAREVRPSAAQIEAAPSAQFDRVVTRTPTGVDEVVRVRSGKLQLGVGALRAGDHVRVATRDAEVEGEGRYDVVVDNEQLREVHVADGRVTVRVTGQQAVFLSTGESWKADTIIARADLDPVAVPAPAPAPAPVPAPVPAPAAAPVAVAAPAAAPAPAATAKPRKPQRISESPAPPAAEPTPPAPTLPAVTELDPPLDPAPAPAPTTDVKPTTGPKEIERRFQAGMSLLKSNKPAEAARELAAAVAAAPDDPLAADARYFQAVALTKAGRKTEAEAALVAFLDRAPKSIRRGRAAVMLARLIAERGDKAAAQAWFESALGDADASVVAAARAGIAALK